MFISLHLRIIKTCLLCRVHCAPGVLLMPKPSPLPYPCVWQRLMSVTLVMLEALSHFVRHPYHWHVELPRSSCLKHSARKTNIYTYIKHNVGHLASSCPILAPHFEIIGFRDSSTSNLFGVCNRSRSLLIFYAFCAHSLALTAFAALSMSNSVFL